SSSCPSSWVHGLYSFSWYGSVGAGQCSVQVAEQARTMILHPDVGEGAKPAGSSLQAGFFIA
ncbi:hypothetical protein, partial [Xanthomonas campestris]|uniref:hypothetical protein n=1 Tax=Xanthomonas campestris TaxID=339 RepID=UPI002B2322E3